jgi:hypothetical protein
MYFLRKRCGPPPAAGGSSDSSFGSFLIGERGQVDPAVRFQVRAAGMILWVTEHSL